MNNLQTKNIFIRKDIIDAAKIYSTQLVGKMFLYVYAGKFFRVLFLGRSFLHLTGVVSKGLNAKRFYDNAKNGTLTENQFDFSLPSHPFNTVKAKILCLKKLPELTNTQIYVLEDLETHTVTFQLAISSLAFTLGLQSIPGDEIGKIFIPKSLRVKGNPLAKCSNFQKVDFIFSKDASKKKFDVLEFADSSKEIPQIVKFMLP